MRFNPTPFILFALIVDLCGINQMVNGDTDCSSDESEESFSENNKDIPVLSLLQRALHIPFQESYAQKCINHRVRLIEDGLNHLKMRIATLHADILLRGSLSDAREAFDSPFYVYDTMKIYWKFSGESEKAAVVRECDRHNPKNALINMARKAIYPSKLFESIVNGSRYSEVVFNATVSVITTEAGVCAILAEECDKFLHNDTFKGRAQALRNQQVKNNLNTIEIEINAARDMLVKHYGWVVVDIIHEALGHIYTTGIRRPEGAKYVQQVLSTKFTSRAWVVTIYPSVHLKAMSVHFHEGTNDNWFHVDNGHNTIIAYSSDKRRNCTSFDRRMHGMKLRQILGDRDYIEFVGRPGENLGGGILLLRRALRRMNMPHDHFISIVSHSQSVSIARDNDYSYHFFQRLTDEDTKKVVKTVLIAWC